MFGDLQDEDEGRRSPGAPIWASFWPDRKVCSATYKLRPVSAAALDKAAAQSACMAAMSPRLEGRQILALNLGAPSIPASKSPDHLVM